jgi:hypothetical protein
VIAGATCEAVARGLIVPASQSLSDRAEIVIPVVELLDAEDIVCGEGATNVKAAFHGPTTTTPELLPCDRDVTIAGVVWVLSRSARRRRHGACIFVHRQRRARQRDDIGLLSRRLTHGRARRARGSAVLSRCNRA